MKKYLLLCLLLVWAAVPRAVAQAGSELKFVLHAEPKTFNPLLVEDDPSESIRYLTGGVLIRVNRLTQEITPELATHWKISNGGRTISFELRPGVRFSDGTPFSVEDVAYTITQLMDPALHSPTGDAFRSGEGQVQVKVSGSDRVEITFPAPIAGLERLFDQVAMMSAKSSLKEMAVLGPYYVAENKAGSYLILKRNPYYWKHDAAGRQLPYVDSVRLDILQNQDTEILRLLRGEIHFINSLNPEYFDKVTSENPGMAHDAGVSLDSEEIWFNQVARSPLPEYKKQWFRSTNFRRAISEAINRQDLARVAFRGYAHPAIGAVSPANKFWFNSRLQAHPFDQQSALHRLGQDGFSLKDGVLRDRDGHVVEFSVITNAGNKYRERMAAMIQQDLAGIGVKLNIVTLDFPSLIERIT
ncbi:MAG TPA: ABC transporter substrate-binding protein, partial [Terriglobales bacterium]|nr:ABC transporter substrate-binding protein [Terriglobales bacterium]